MRLFLGKCNYFNEFIENYSTIASPLYELTKDLGNKKYIWTEIHEEAFNKLKKCLCSPPILAHFNPELETEFRTDASTIGLGYKLTQFNPNTQTWHPVSYGSKKLTEAEMKYPTTELETLALVTALKQYRP